MSAARPPQVLTVCTFNQTRSVMLEVLLHHHLLQRGVTHHLASAGVLANGRPPTTATVEELARRGHDVRQHRGTRLTAEAVAASDLILCAERDHVIHVVGNWPDAWTRTFTVPELVVLAGDPGSISAPSDEPAEPAIALRRWLDAVSAQRTRSTYRMDDIPEVSDPTGSPPRQFAAAAARLDDQAALIADHLAHVLGGRRR